MTRNELKRGNTKRSCKGTYGDSLVKIFKYRQPFGLQFCFCHQVDNHSNRRQYPILLEIKSANKFWTDNNFAWYLSVT